jgi:hypothetical protein
MVTVDAIAGVKVNHIVDGTAELKVFGKMPGETRYEKQ